MVRPLLSTVEAINMITGMLLSIGSWDKIMKIPISRSYLIKNIFDYCYGEFMFRGHFSSLFSNYQNYGCGWKKFQIRWGHQSSKQCNVFGLSLGVLICLDRDSQSWHWQRVGLDSQENLNNFKKLGSIKKSHSKLKNLNFVSTPPSSLKSLDWDWKMLWHDIFGKSWQFVSISIES